VRKFVQALWQGSGITHIKSKGSILFPYMRYFRIMQNQGAVVVASLMIIVLSFMFYLFSNVLNFFLIGIGMGLFIIITAMFFMLGEIRDAMIEMSEALEMNNVFTEASGRGVKLKASEPSLTHSPNERPGEPAISDNQGDSYYQDSASSHYEND
jgi:hypothetical protein